MRILQHRGYKQFESDQLQQNNNINHRINIGFCFKHMFMQYRSGFKRRRDRALDSNLLSFIERLKSEKKNACQHAPGHISQ